MKYLLDTNILIYIIKNKPPQSARRFSRLSPEDLATSSLVLSELMFGAMKSQYSNQAMNAIHSIAAALTVLPYDTNAADHYAEIRFELERNGTPIGAMDLLIAAHARSQSLVLVTNNVKEFQRVPGLKVENWAV